jgi:hypothetical protein
VRGRLCKILIGLVLLATPELRAQVVRGTVREIGTKAPLSNVEVLLFVDASDSAVARGTTDRGGTFRLVAPKPGSYSIGLRRIGFEQLATTATMLGARDTMSIALEMIRTAVNLDTVRVRDATSLFGVTAGRDQFLSHYREGAGLFISGAEIQASKLGIGAYLAKLPGMADLGGSKNAADFSGGGTRPEDFGKPSRLRTQNDAQDMTHFALRDEMGRNIVSVDAPCVTTRVDRLGPVVGIVGSQLRVQQYTAAAPKPMVGVIVTEVDPMVPAGELTVHLNEIIGIEVYRNPSEIPAEWKKRGWTLEEQRDSGRCAHIQFWTRTAW